MYKIYSLLYGNVEIIVKAIYTDNPKSLIKVNLEAIINGRKIVVKNHTNTSVVPRGRYDYPACAYTAYCVLAKEYNKSVQKTLDSLISPHNKKPSDFKVSCFFLGDLIKTFDSIQDAATQLKLNPKDIRRVCEIKDRQRKTCGGYEWRYVNDNGDIILPWLELDEYKGDETYFRGIPTRLDERNIPWGIRKDMLKDKDLCESLSDQGFYAKDERERKRLLAKEREESDIREFVKNLASNGKQLKCVYQTGTQELYHGLDFGGVLMIRLNFVDKSIDVTYNVYDLTNNYSKDAKLKMIKTRFKKTFGDNCKWQIL